MQDDDTQSGPGTANAGREGHLPSPEELREEAAGVADVVRDEFGQLRDEAAHEARETVHAAQRQARDYAERQRAAAADSVQAIANALYSSGDTLEAEGREAIAAYWRRGAASAEDLARWMEGKSLGDIWQQAQHYARRQPGVSFGAALAAGFVFARLMKSTARHRPETQSAAPGFATQDRPTAATTTTPTSGTPTDGITDY